jgi:hypothetical protein
MFAPKSLYDEFLGAFQEQAIFSQAKKENRQFPWLTDKD